MAVTILNENYGSTNSGVYTFKADEQIKKEVPQADKYSGENVVITGTDIEPQDNKFETGYYSIQFDNGFTLSAVSGKLLKEVPNKLLTEGATKLIKGEGDTFVNVGTTWKVLAQNEEDTVIVALDENGEPTDRYVVVWGLQKDGSWNQGHYFSDKQDAMKYYNSRVPTTESASKVVTESVDNTIYKTAISTSNELPDHASGLWLRIRRDNSYYPEYYSFINNVVAKQAYKELVNGYIPPEDISDIALGFTASDGSEQIRWQDYADNFTPYIEEKVEGDMKISDKLQEDKELTEDPSNALERIGYKQTRNKSGEILYSSDTLYSPGIYVFGSVIEVIPLEDLPVSMTIEDHGKMIARLAQVQKVLEDLK